MAGLQSVEVTPPPCSIRPSIASDQNPVPDGPRAYVSGLTRSRSGHPVGVCIDPVEAAPGPTTADPGAAHSDRMIVSDSTRNRIPTVLVVAEGSALAWLVAVSTRGGWLGAIITLAVTAALARVARPPTRARHDVALLAFAHSQA